MSGPAILLIILGAGLGPGYYGYCEHLSRENLQSITVAERADRWTLPDGTIQRTTAKVRVRDVDSLPWPAWDLVPVATYLDGGHMIGVDRGRSMPMNATRGCPYQCTFCSSPAMWTTKYVTRSPADVVTPVGGYVPGG